MLRAAGVKIFTFKKLRAAGFEISNLEFLSVIGFVIRTLELLPAPGGVNLGHTFKRAAGIKILALINNLPCSTLTCKNDKALHPKAKRLGSELLM